MEKPSLTPRTGRSMEMPVSVEDRIKFFTAKLEELEAEKAEQAKQQFDQEAELLQKITAFGYTVTPIEGKSTKAQFVNTSTEDATEEEEPQAWYYDVVDFVKNFFTSTGKSIGISSSAGMWTMVVTLAILILGFAWYPVFFKGNLNESEIRIHNAATLHFFSHVWMAMGVLLLGFGFQFLAFNEHFRYLWTNIKTDQSASEDFRIGDAQAKVRLITALFTWAFPVWIITQMFQFILG